ncbi:hypothetical protein SISSUDRAFT_1043385 [Sistotremastrum suecicum HHB10207 ss-3]|uniref:Uncharacterized protein n=1 Tax=Sistotremastrum suecicum HHB10207 ss-3 TaxID=1314776 RepID=A0A166FWU4_9AGAM|nr:hypothetical protein SISSUDRAFT_1043385 [Sistotremastrum suecicum HHB10207 ss-3]
MAGSSSSLVRDVDTASRAVQPPKSYADQEVQTDICNIHRNIHLSLSAPPIEHYDVASSPIIQDTNHDNDYAQLPPLLMSTSPSISQEALTSPERPSEFSPEQDMEDDSEAEVEIGRGIPEADGAGYDFFDEAMSEEDEIEQSLRLSPSSDYDTTYTYGPPHPLNLDLSPLQPLSSLSSPTSSHTSRVVPLSEALSPTPNTNLFFNIQNNSDRYFDYEAIPSAAYNSGASGFSTSSPRQPFNASNASRNRTMLIAQEDLSTMFSPLRKRKRDVDDVGTTSPRDDPRWGARYLASDDTKDLNGINPFRPAFTLSRD